MRKLIWITGFILALAVPTLAQQQAPEINLKVNNSELETIGKALGKLTFDEVAPLIQKLRTQVVEQQQAATPVPTPAPKPKE